MTTFKRSIAAAQLLLIFPAVLFMTALFVRQLEPLELEPARTAENIVHWYATHPPIGLWVLLMALPLAVLLTGCATILHGWKTDAELRRAAHAVLSNLRAHGSAVLAASATLASLFVLAIVALHALTN